MLFTDPIEITMYYTSYHPGIENVNNLEPPTDCPLESDSVRLWSSARVHAHAHAHTHTLVDVTVTADSDDVSPFSTLLNVHRSHLRLIMDRQPMG